MIGQATKEGHRIVKMAAIDFFVSETCWQDEADLQAITQVVLPSKWIERFKKLVWCQKRAVEELKRLRREDENYHFGGDLRAKTLRISRSDEKGFDMIWLHHDCLALNRLRFNNILFKDADFAVHKWPKTIDYLGSICCSLLYSRPPEGHETISGKSPYTGKPLFLHRDPASPRSFSLYLTDHDPMDAQTAAIFANYLMVYFAATVKVLYYTAKTAREIQALSWARLHGRQDETTEHFYKVILPQLAINATQGAELAAVIAKHLAMADDVFLKSKAQQSRQWIEDSGTPIAFTHSKPLNEEDLLRMLKGPESETVEFKSSFLRPSDQEIEIKRKKITDPETYDREIKKLEIKIKVEVLEAVLELMNSRGGYVIIGVNPTREIVGLNFDYELRHQRKTPADDPCDCFDRYIAQELANHVEIQNRELVPSMARRRFIKIEGKMVCCVTVEPVMSGKGIFDENGILHIRQGGASGKN